MPVPSPNTENRPDAIQSPCLLRKCSRRKCERACRKQQLPPLN